MMRALLAVSAVALAACATTAISQDGAQTVPQADVRHEMQTEINPAIVSIWDITNNALDDNGNLDPALITTDGWAQIAAGAAKLAASSDRMANAASFISASPGNWATEDYEVSMDVVQHSLDADPAAFRTYASLFGNTARQLEAAATARDGAAAAGIVARLDGECSACHNAFWYPEN